MLNDSVTVQVSRLTAQWTTPVDEYVTVMALAGDTLAVGTAEGVLHRLSATTGQPLYKAQPLMPMSITQLAWSGTQLAASGQDATVWVCNGNDTPLKRRFDKGWVDHIAWHPTEPWLLVGAERQVFVWDVANDTLLYESAGLPKNVMGVAWHPNLRQQFALLCGNTLQRFDMTKPAPTRQFSWGALLFDLHWSPDGQVLATATHDNGLHIWYAKTGNDLHMSGYPGRVKTMCWQPNSRFIATAGDSDITIWDFDGKGPAGSMPVVLGAHQAKVTQVTYCGTQLASGDADGQVFVWLPPEKPDYDTPEPPLWAYPAGSAITQLLYPLADVLFVGTEDGDCIRLGTP